MSQATTTCRSIRRTMHKFFPSNAGEPSMADCARETFGRVAHDRATSVRESTPHPGARAPQLTVENANDRVTRLLLIDHDPAQISTQLRRMFTAPGRGLHVAENGDDGLECVRNEAPDVVILALGLPDASGLDVYQQIRRISARVPVIFLTDARRADAAIEVMK